MQLIRPTLKRLVLLTLGLYGTKSFIILRGSKIASIFKKYILLKEDANKILCRTLETYRKILEIFSNKVVEKLQDKRVVIILR